jgi:hypothetical protein
MKGWLVISGFNTLTARVMGQDLTLTFPPNVVGYCPIYLSFEAARAEHPKAEILEVTVPESWAKGRKPEEEG